MLRVKLNRMGRISRSFLALFLVFLLGGSSALSEPVASCESVCEKHGEAFGKSLHHQWDRLFNGQRVCRFDPVGSRTESRDLVSGARMASSVLTGGCPMNRPVLEDFREAVESEGSEGLVRRSLEMVGLLSKPGCVQAVAAGAPLMRGDVLRLGHQAMVVASVGDDPFRIRALLEAHQGPFTFPGKSLVSGAQQLCREWLMESSQFQVSVIFLSREGGVGPRVRQGTFGSLISEDHPGSLWDQALQEWALPACVQKVMGRGDQASLLPAPRLKAERHSGVGAGCRGPATIDRSFRGSECALCCATGGRAP